MVNVSKTYPEPSSLVQERNKKSGSYNQADVLKQLEVDFNKKCYICEQKNLNNINIEHFEAHSGDFKLKLSWENLFLACSHCNNIKSDNAVFNTILNCTNSTHTIEEWVHHFIKTAPREKPLFTDISPVNLDASIKEKVKNTVALLQAVYEGTTAQKKAQAASICSLVTQEMFKFTSCLYEYYDEDIHEEDKASRLRKLEMLLSRKSKFAAFKRTVIRDSIEAYADLAHLLG